MKHLIKFFTLLILLTFSGLAMAQITDAEAQKATKEQKNEAEQQALDENYALVKEWVTTKNVVLNANMIWSKYSFYNNTIGPNFIRVNGDELIIQTANPFYIGSNGLGGVTIHCRISDYNVTETGESISVLMQVTSAAIGQSTVTLFTTASGQADAVIQTNFGQRLTFIGTLASGDDAPLEGMPIF